MLYAIFTLGDRPAMWDSNIEAASHAAALEVVSLHETRTYAERILKLDGRNSITVLVVKLTESGAVRNNCKRFLISEVAPPPPPVTYETTEV